MSKRRLAGSCSGFGSHEHSWRVFQSLKKKPAKLRESVRAYANPLPLVGASPDGGILNLMKRGATIIQVDPEVLSGRPVFAGTRVPAEALLEHLKHGRSLAEFLADFPAVTEDQAVAALEEAKEALLARARRPADSVIDLLDSWLEEDSRHEGGLKSWEQLKRNLDRDRLSSRPLFS